MAYQTLDVKMDQHVLTLTLNRPEVRNAFNEEVIDELTEVFSGPAREDSVRAIVLKGAGKVFCAGGDLNWMKKAVDFDFDQNLADTRKLARMFALMNECPKPLIGAVHGAAIGGGVGLVSVCDLVAATRDTVFSLSEVRLGIVPACIGPFVVAKVGASHARRLFVSAERFRSEHAQAIGLIHESVEDEHALEKQVSEWTQSISQCGPNAVKVAKQLVLDLSWPERRSQLPDCLESIAKTLAQLRISDEGQEGVRAFLEKRKPSWLQPSGQPSGPKDNS